jgi:hypothetical protein
MSSAIVCPDTCAQQAAAQLLGPLRPAGTTCAHGVRRTLDDVFPPVSENGSSHE